MSREITSRGLTPFIEQTQYSPDAAEHALTSNPFSGQLFDGEILHATGLGTNLPLAKLNGGRLSYCSTHARKRQPWMP